MSDIPDHLKGAFVIDTIDPLGLGCTRLDETAYRRECEAELAQAQEVERARSHEYTATRDMFAAQALQLHAVWHKDAEGFVTHPNVRETARRAYEMADAMMAERVKR